MQGFTFYIFLTCFKPFYNFLMDMIVDLSFFVFLSRDSMALFAYNLKIQYVLNTNLDPFTSVCI